jgi:hypothetical protein
MQQKHSNEPSGGSTMVKPFSHYPRMEGSNPAAGTRGEEMGKKVYHMKVTELVYAPKIFQ